MSPRCQAKARDDGRSTAPDTLRLVGCKAESTSCTFCPTDQGCGDASRKSIGSPVLGGTPARPSNPTKSTTGANVPRTLVRPHTHVAAPGTGVKLDRTKTSRTYEISTANCCCPNSNDRSRKSIFTVDLDGHRHDAPPNQLDAKQAVEHLGDVERAHSRIANDLFDCIFAIDELEHGELLSRQATATELAHSVFVAQEYC